MTEELHSIKNCIKWKHEPNYDRELSKCNFLRSQTSASVGRFCKPEWHKLHQQHMSALNKNKYVDSITWRLINSRTLQICKGMEFIFWEAHIKLWYTGRQSQKLIMTSGKSRISTRNQTVIHCGTNNIEENSPNDLANEMVCYVPLLQSKKEQRYKHRTSPDFYPVASEKST